MRQKQGWDGYLSSIALTKAIRKKRHRIADELWSDQFLLQQCNQYFFITEVQPVKLENSHQQPFAFNCGTSGTRVIQLFQYPYVSSLGWLRQPPETDAALDTLMCCDAMQQPVNTRVNNKNLKPSLRCKLKYYVLVAVVLTCLHWKSPAKNRARKQTALGHWLPRWVHLRVCVSSCIPLWNLLCGMHKSSENSSAGSGRKSGTHYRH